MFFKKSFSSLLLCLALHSTSHAGKFNPEEWEFTDASDFLTPQAQKFFFSQQDLKNSYLEEMEENLQRLQAHEKEIQSHKSKKTDEIYSSLCLLRLSYVKAFNASQDHNVGYNIWEKCIIRVKSLQDLMKTTKESFSDPLLTTLDHIFGERLNNITSPFDIYTKSFLSFTRSIGLKHPFLAVLNSFLLEKDLDKRAKILLTHTKNLQKLSPPAWNEKIKIFQHLSRKFIPILENFTRQKKICIDEFNKIKNRAIRGHQTFYDITKVSECYRYILVYGDCLLNFTKINFCHKETKSIISFSKDDEKIFTDILAGISHAASPQAILQKSKTPTPKIPNVLPSPNKEEKKAQENDSLVSAPTALTALAIEQSPISQADTLVVPVPQEKEPEDTPVEALRAQLIDVQTALEGDTENFPLYTLVNSLLRQLAKNSSEPVLSQIQEAASSLYTRYREVKPKNKSFIIVPKNHEDTFLRLMYTPLCYLKDNVRFGSIKTLIEGLGGKVHDDCAGSRIKITLGKETCGIHIHDKHNNLIDGGRIASLRKFFLDAGVQLKDE